MVKLGKHVLNVNNKVCEQVIVRLIDWGFKTYMESVILRVSIQKIMIIKI